MKYITEWGELVKFYPGNAGPIGAELIGVSRCDGSYRVRRRHASVTVIEYVVSGQGYVCVDGKKWLVTPDHIYLLPAGTNHEYYADPEDPWTKIFINLRGELPLTLIKSYGLEGQPILDGAGMKPLFERIAAITEREDGHPEEEGELCALFFEVLFQLSRRQVLGQHSPEAVRLKEYLDCHAHTAVSNTELAAIIFRSPDYCIKLFKREYGITPYEYQLRSRLQMAERLLRNTALPVAQVAAQVGYSDPCYFSAVFRQRYGVSPRQFRAHA